MSSIPFHPQTRFRATHRNNSAWRLGEPAIPAPVEPAGKPRREKWVVCGNWRKENDVGIIGRILGKREREVAFRTIDGGHPAPFPDMTDEQLYNYEIAFDVPNKTFDAPPMAQKAASDQNDSRDAPQPSEEDTGEFGGKPFDVPRYSGRAAKGELPEPPQASCDVAPLDFTRPVRLITSKQPVEIITTRARHPVFKVHGYIGDDNVVTVFTLNGQLSENGPRFLENMPMSQQLYLNIYLNPDRRSADQYLVTQHVSKEEADAAATPGRLASVQVPFD